MCSSLSGEVKSKLVLFRGEEILKYGLTGPGQGDTFVVQQLRLEF